jgi:hypothetical protein
MSQRTERKHRRVRARSVTAHVQAGASSLAGEVENVSQSGLFVRTDDLLDVGFKVQVELARIGGKPVISLPGVVADTLDAIRAESLGRKKGIGIRFDPIQDPSLRDKLERLLRDLAGVLPLKDVGQPAPAELTIEHTPITHSAPTQGDGAELARLRMQVRDLRIDVSDLKRSVAERDSVIAQQRKELEQLRRALEES